MKFTYIFRYTNVPNKHIIVEKKFSLQIWLPLVENTLAKNRDKTITRFKMMSHERCCKLL